MKTPTLKGNKGLTLIELTVVIVVLLGLISVLFISARAWIEGSNKAKCIVNLSSIQKAAVSYANLNQVPPSTYSSGITFANLTDNNMVPASIACPTSGTAYSLAPVDNDQDSVWVQCADPNFGGATLVDGNGDPLPAAEQPDGSHVLSL